MTTNDKCQATNICHTFSKRSNNEDMLYLSCKLDKPLLTIPMNDELIEYLNRKNEDGNITLSKEDAEKARQLFKLLDRMAEYLQAQIFAGNADYQMAELMAEYRQLTGKE